MHKLHRETVPKPDLLKNYDYRKQTWDKLTGEAKKTLRLSLQKMQCKPIDSGHIDDNAHTIPGLRCAYCEGPIYFGGHIEHFRRKNQSHYPELTFEWQNLFIACDSTSHCGHYKDNGAGPYDPDHLLKPDDHDPDYYLYFHASGEVRVRNNANLSQLERKQGEETIRVFHLNCGSLAGARRKALKQYLDKNKGIMEDLMDFDDGDRAAFIYEEIEATKWDPFWTTIRHFFEKLQ